MELEENALFGIMKSVSSNHASSDEPVAQWPETLI